MSYNKHNFQQGQVLNAQDLNEIEDGIVGNDTAISALQNELIEVRWDDVETTRDSSNYWGISNGKIIKFASSSYFCLEAIEVQKGQKYKIIGNRGTSSKVYAISVVDSDFKLLSNHDPHVNAVVEIIVDITEDNAKYLCISMHDSLQTIKIEVHEDKISVFSRTLNTLKNDEYLNCSISMFKSLCVLGDSWNSGYWYTSSGATTEKNESSWGANLCRRNNLSFLCAARRSSTTRNVVDPTQTDFYNYTIKRILEGNACDIYVINLGANDANHIGSSYLGTIDDIHDEDSSLNADTFYGNYGRIIEIIKNKAPNARIVLSMYYNSTLANHKNRKAFFEAMTNIASHYGLPYFNWDDDAWYHKWLDYESKFMRGDHPVATAQSAISLCFERLFSRVVDTYQEYFSDLRYVY